MENRDTESKILYASITLFSNYGYDDVDMREIAFEAGVSMETLHSFYPSKEALMDAIIIYVEENFDHYAPTNEEINVQLRTLSPDEILINFMIHYHWSNKHLLLSIVRLIYMEQYHNKKIEEISYEYLIRQPTTNIINTLEYLMYRKAIPKCDARAFAEIWNRTALVFGMVTSHMNGRMYEEYCETIKFIIQLIVKGVHFVDADVLFPQWNNRRMNIVEETRGSDTKSRIRSKALKLFASYGYHKVSIKKIADEAETSVSSIYRYYRNKNEILSECVKEIIDNHRITGLNPDIQVNKDSDIAGAFTWLSPMKNGEQEIQLYTILFGEQYYNEDIKDLFFSLIYRDCYAVKKIIDQYIELEMAVSCDSELVSRIYVYTMYSLAIGETVYAPDHGDIPDLRKRITAIIVSYLLYGFIDKK